MRLIYIRLIILSAFAIFTLAGCAGGGTAEMPGSSSGSDMSGGASGQPMSESASPSTSTSYAYAFSFGSEGSADGQLDSPVGIAQDSSGNIYVTDGVVQKNGFGNNRIEEFTAQGVFVESITGSGAKSSQFAAPKSLAIDHDGNIYCVVSPGIVLQTTSAGNVQASIGSQGAGSGQYGNPNSVFLGSAKTLLVTDLAQNQIDKYTTAGVYQSSLNAGGTLLHPWAGASDMSGNIFVTDNGHQKIVKLSDNGKVLTTFAPPSGKSFDLRGIAVDRSGNVYVVDAANCVVDKFDNSGNFLTSMGASGNGNGQLATPSDVLVSATGNVYVVDSGNDRVEVFSAQKAGASPALLS